MNKGFRRMSFLFFFIFGPQVGTDHDQIGDLDVVGRVFFAL
jgi:hypothetical protein